MTQSSDYREYLISAIDDENALELANSLGLDDSSWFRLPSSLDDEPEAFKRQVTDILPREAWAFLEKDEYEELSLTGFPNERVLFAKNFSSAAKYAAQHNWWLRAWKFVEDSELDEVIEYGFYC